MPAKLQFHHLIEGVVLKSLLKKTLLRIKFRKCRFYSSKVPLSSTIGSFTTIEKGVNCSGEFELGDYSYINYNTNIFNCKIGKFCSIASDCTIGAHEHSLEQFTTHPIIFNKYYGIVEGKLLASVNKQTEIGNDVWIGHRAFIKQGVKVSDGAVIGAGSIVTKDIPAYEVWAGNPARLIKKRKIDNFPLDTKEWWDLPVEELKRWIEQCF